MEGVLKKHALFFLSFRENSTSFYEGGDSMGRMLDFLICKECGTLLLDRYHNDELVILEVMDETIAYRCPICGKTNATKISKRKGA